MGEPRLYAPLPQVRRQQAVEIVALPADQRHRLAAHQRERLAGAFDLGDGKQRRGLHAQRSRDLADRQPRSRIEHLWASLARTPAPRRYTRRDAERSRAGGLVAHPGGQFAKNADALLDEQKISRSADGALSDPQATPIKWMPGVGDAHEP